MQLSLFCSLLVVICSSGAFAEPAPGRAELLVGRYLEAAREQQEKLRGIVKGAVKDLPRWATEKEGLVKALIEVR